MNMQDPRCYSVHVSSSSEHAHSYEGSCGRTETAHLCVNPEFMNSSFLIRLPYAMGTSLKPQTLLTCQLWATPSVEKGVAHVCSEHAVPVARIPMHEGTWINERSRPGYRRRSINFDELY
jgi:hypothetical protein